jgi:hypothetical protein
VLPGFDVGLFRGVTVRARAPVVFRWLCQLRVAPYSYDWLDNLGRRSPRTLTPGAERLELGQRVMGIFELVGFEPDRHLTLRLRKPGISTWTISYLSRRATRRVSPAREAGRASGPGCATGSAAKSSLARLDQRCGGSCST